MAQNKKFNDAAVGFRPQTAFPLNANEYFESLEAAQAAASTAEEVGTSAAFRTTYYIGQVLAVYDKQKDPASVAVYQIAPDKTLQSIAAGDFGKYVKNEDLSGYVESAGEKKYKISIDANGKAYVNVPWTGGSSGDVAVDDITIGKNVRDNNKLFLKSVPDGLLSAVSVQISSLSSQISGNFLSGEYPDDASKYLDGTGQWSQPSAAVLLKKW